MFTKWLSILVVVLVLLTAHASRLLAAELLYDGKTLAQWTAELDGYPWVHGQAKVSTNSPIGQALFHFGTNAVPFLVGELQARDSAFKKKAFEVISTKTSLTPPAPELARHERALGALSVLGPLGKDAIPALTNYLYAGQDYSFLAILALAMMGRDAVPPLSSALVSTNVEIRRMAARILWEGSIDGAEETIPILLAGLKDPDHWVRTESVRALAAIGKKPEVIVPAIKEKLTDTNVVVVRAAETALKKFRAARRDQEKEFEEKEGSIKVLDERSPAGIGQ